MKKYVNGKIIDMTEKDIARAQARKPRHETKTDNSVYEKRIADLEQLVENLLAQQAEPETKEEQ